MKTSNISFTSRIKVVNYASFYNEVKKFNPLVSINNPWTAKEIVRANKAFTTDIKTCTAGGILTKAKAGEGYDVVMFHLCPPFEAAPENKNLKGIEAALEEKLDSDKPIQAFLIGSKGSTIFRYSVNFFSHIEEIIKKFNVPYTKIQGLDDPFAAHIAFNGEKNLWLIEHHKIDPPIIKPPPLTSVDSFVLCDKDKFIP